MADNTKLKTFALTPPKAPNLLIAPVDYTQQYQDQFSNALRLYFAQIDNFAQPFTNQNGGSYLQFPFIAASDDATQYATADNTPTVVQWSTLDVGSGFTLNVNHTATAQYPGTYKITYSMQLANDDNAPRDVIVWLRVNGLTSTEDVSNSTTIFTIPARKSAGVPSYICGYSEVVFELNAGDYVSLWWGTDKAATSGGTTGASIIALPAATTPMPYPAVPSVIGSITFVSALLA